MEENRSRLRRYAIGIIVSIYVFFMLLAVVAFFVVTELENDNIVHDTQLERGVVTVVFVLIWTFVCFRLYRINTRIFDQRSQIFDAREAEYYAARELARLREQFMANMSHEIRTPLNAIVGFGHLLSRSGLESRERELVSNIQIASENLLNIVNDILDFSKIQAGMMTLESLPFEPVGLFRSILQMFMEKARQKTLTLELQVANDLPDHLLGDPTRLTQIMVNLIGNALKFTQRGGIVVQVGAEKQESKDGKVMLRIDVRDSGIGIPSNQLERIFERFTQSDEQTTRIYGGTGLGLSIVKGLVEAMQGTVQVQSEQGKGSVFTVLIPLEQAPEATALSAQADLHPRQSVKPSLAGVHVLVAEDNLMNRRVVELLFEEWACDYMMAANGREAVALLAQSPAFFDLVLMDLQMPEMDGYEATQLIRKKLGLTVPIIAMTAHALAGEREKCIQLGMDDYIAKPIREQELYELIERHVRKEIVAADVQMDRDYFRKTTLDNTEYQSELAGIFLDQTPKDIQSIATALSAADLNAAARAAHNMKSTVGYMGFAESIGKQLSAFEQACTDGKDIALLRQELEMIVQAVDKARTIIEQEFQQKNRPES